MRTSTRVATVLLMTGITAAAGGIWGGALTAPVVAPVATSTGVRAVQPAPAQVRVGTAALATGVALPAGSALLGAPSVSSSDGGLRRWECTVDLAGASPAAALAIVRADLRAHGFDVQGGTSDVFAVRRCEGRWEIVVARVALHGTGEDATQVLELGIGSRPA